MAVKDPIIDPDRKLLYRNFHEIGDKFKVVYLVELSRTKNKFFVILFPDFDDTSLFLHQILQFKVAEKLLKQVGCSYLNFVYTLDIKFGKLVINNYHNSLRDSGHVDSIFMSKIDPRPIGHQSSRNQTTGRTPKR